jgi:predicted  nucleic acid-binding Zn-ribbon protein
MAPIALARFLLVGLVVASAVEVSSGAAVNPIRKVVTMLQMMQNKVTAEGKAAEELYDKFMCYCETGKEALEKSIADAEAKIVQLEAAVKESAALKEQLEAEIKEHKTSRAEAKDALAKAEALRKKEAGAFASATSELASNIDALTRAIAALEKGVAGGFLQTNAASVLRRLSLSMDMSSADREILAAFLSQGSSAEYVPQSGEIIGILKQMKDEMEADLAEAKANEEKAIADYKALVAAKKKEIEAATKAIEDKMTRVGELGVEVATMINDLEDTKEGLEEDKKFLADMDRICEQKKKEWAVYQKMMAEELLALADTIKILNDDDALELFKKTLPSAASFLQLQVSVKEMRQQALLALSGVRPRGVGRDARLDLLEMALQGKKMGFEKIIKMIDDLVALLAKEQLDDDEKKAWCLAELDTADDKKKALENSISDLEKAIADAEESIATLKSEIEALEDAIKALDKQVAEATEQRKAEHAEFEENLAANSAAVDLLGFAKNRLNKFYNPKLYKAPPKRELSAEDRIVTSMGGTLAPTAAPGGIAGTGIGLAQVSDAPPPPPEADLAYKKKGEEGTGVIAMIDLLIGDLEKEITEAKVDEKDAQEDYESFMKDSAEKRALDSQAIADKEGSKAALEEQLLANQEALKADQIDLMDTEKYIMEVHAECDWLLEHFDLRKEARTGEVEALKKAKDVLSGADYSF